MSQNEKDINVVETAGAPNDNAQLPSDIPEDTQQAKDALKNAAAQTNAILEGDSVNQFQAWNTAESQTDAAVELQAQQEDDADQSDDESGQPENGDINVVEDQEAPNDNTQLPSDVPPASCQAAADGLADATKATDDLIEADNYDQFQGWNTAYSQTEAAVQMAATCNAGKMNEDNVNNGVPTGDETAKAQSAQTPGEDINVVEDAAAPNDNTQLPSDVPPASCQAAADGLADATKATDDLIESDNYDQFQGWNTAYSQTEAAVQMAATCNAGKINEDNINNGVEIDDAKEQADAEAAEAKKK